MAGSLALMKEVVEANRSGANVSPEAAGMMVNDLSRGLAAQGVVEGAQNRQAVAVKQQMQNDFVQGKMSLSDIAKTGMMTDSEIASLAQMAAALEK